MDSVTNAVYLAWDANGPVAGYEQCNIDGIGLDHFTMVAAGLLITYV